MLLVAKTLPFVGMLPQFVILRFEAVVIIATFARF